MERVAGIEPVSQPWEGRILPVNYTRLSCCYIKLLAQALRNDAIEKGSVGNTVDRRKVTKATVISFR